MKAELMIGDWVYRPDCYDQVKEIRQNGIIGLDSLRGLIGFSEIEPIPLTAEILEKNGFVYKEAEKTCATDAFHLWWLDGSIFTLDDDSWWRQIKDGKLRVKFGGFPLKYVHELQHALRLCNIEKEIIV